MVKHTQAIHRLLPTNCLSMFDTFVGFTFKELLLYKINYTETAILEIYTKS